LSAARCNSLKLNGSRKRLFASFSGFRMRQGEAGDQESKPH